MNYAQLLEEVKFEVTKMFQNGDGESLCSFLQARINLLL
jgi:hypothetical protein